jgi:hypothetical protein
MLAQAMSSRKATAPSNASNTGFTSPTVFSSMGTSFTPQPWLSGFVFAVRSTMTAISLCASVSVTPGCRRAITLSERPP